VTSSSVLRRLTPLVLVLLAGCGHTLHRFPLAPPLWDDVEDRRAFGPPPEEYYSSFYWDGADQMVFRPLTQLVRFEAESEARNVNALDEVPDSSWYVNRLTRERLSSERLVRAGCDEDPVEPTEPWTIIDAKPNGGTPGFVIEDADGRRFLIKLDSEGQPERSTTADVLGSMLYWAAGFHAPCNRIVAFERSDLRIAEGTTVEFRAQGSLVEEELTFELLEPAFRRAEDSRYDNGQYRAAASRFVPGRPIGPWRYEGTWDEDPNDVIPHEDRRELRGGYVLAAWLNHYDSREQNSLAVWMEPEHEAPNGYVRHYYIDFGDCFGSEWNNDGLSRRLGHSAYFDAPHILADFFTFGLIDRPWRHARRGPAGTRLGYYDAFRFEPDRWRPGYPNPAFLEATERDKAWMTRVIAEIRPEDIRAMVDASNITDDTMSSELYRILLDRRERILRRYFEKISPLTQPRVIETPRSDEGTRSLCLRDLAVSTGVVDALHRPYVAQAWEHLGGSRVAERERGRMFRMNPDLVCVELPRLESTPEDPGYLVVDVLGLFDRGDTTAAPARVHLYQLGDDDYRVVGIERPYDRSPPGS